MQVSARDVVPPSSACGCHNSSLSDFSQPSADTPLLLSATVVWRTNLFGVRNSCQDIKDGRPRRYTEWLSSWFINRKAMVRVICSRGHSRTFKVDLPLGSVISPLRFAMYIDDLLTEFVKDTFVSAFADDLLIARRSSYDNMMVASIQPEVDGVAVWSDRARLALETSNARQLSAAWTMQKRSGNPTTPLIEKKCFAIHSRFSCVSDTTDRSPWQSMCESSVNRFPTVSASSVLWKARPLNSTLWTGVRTISRLRVECLTMQLQPGRLGCQLPPPANLT